MRATCIAASLLLGLGLAAGGASAQLISPGPLIEAHAELEGALNCTQCHQLRQRGASADKCLSCHAPIRARIARSRGLHGQIDASDCGSCHTDHAGKDADIVRFDADAFDHAEAGFLLVGVHQDLECTSCHTSERIFDREVRRQKAGGGTLGSTYLGVAPTCRGCHRREDPHGEEFGVDDCASCHANTSWDDLEVFDHDATAYPLTGAHLQTDCSSCHSEGQTYKGLDFSGCASCHSDPHRRAFGSNCTSCHTTAGWAGVSTGRVERSFNHRATGFVLSGAHADADCSSCHTRSDLDEQRAAATTMTWGSSSSTGYDPPLVDRGCLSCHLDYHEGDLAQAQDGPDCRGCHTERAWNPSAFDFRLHGRTDFPLEGAHQAVVCEACHTAQAPAIGQANTLPRIVFALEWSDCTSCHSEIDPHRGQFGQADCAQCHSVEDFKATDFDHDKTSFPLDDTHQLPCTSCHIPESSQGFIRYAGIGNECRDCHT